MLPRENRLPSKEAQDIKKKASSGFFSLYFAAQKKEKPRFLVVVGAKTQPLAAKRNNLKRIMREVVLKEAKGIDGVLVALPSAGNLNPKDARTHIKDLFRKI